MTCSGVTNMQKKTKMFLIQNKYLSCNCSNPKHLLILYVKRSRSVWQKLFKLKALSSLSVCLSVSVSLSVSPPPPPHPPPPLSLWHWGVKLVVKICQLWQPPGQGGWHQMRSAAVHCLCHFLATLLTSHISFAYVGLTTFCSSAPCHEKQGRKLDFFFLL